MNAPVKAQTCPSDLSYCKFGSETLLKLLAVFEDQIGGVIKNDDIEYVHKTRVTSRRLRAAMPLFGECFRRKEFKEWLCEIKKVTRLLGEARDLDVQIIFVEEYMKKIASTAEKAYVDMLVKDHRERRNSIQSIAVNGLEELKATDVLNNLGKSCEKIITEQTEESFEPQKVLEKARWHISFRLDDFLAMENYVCLENEVLKHHEMRICAKKLRYTMETFSLLYHSKLSQEIETIKAFQDVLGEMHDCDVWTEYIPKFMQKQKLKVKSKTKKKPDNKKAEQALLNFLNYVKEKRKEHYLEFVRLWDENKKEDFFVQLRKTINDEFLAGDEKKIVQVLHNPNVKVAVFSDVHANLPALERIMEDAEELGVDVFVNAGDSVGFGACPNEVVELLSEKNVLSIVGNYDVEVIEGKAKAKGEKNLALKFARKELAKSSICYLYSLPRELRLEVAGKSMLVTHGSPESIEEHIYHNTPAKRLKTLAGVAKSDLIAVGHSHEQFWRQINGTWFINPGSAGRPGDGNPQAAYAILSFNPFNVELLRVDYDVEAAATALRKKGLPESFAQMMLRGVSLDAIIDEDKAREELMVQNCKGTLQVCREISEKYEADRNHFLQVSKLALGLFDRLSRLHKLDARERCWLECAVVLHDVGLSKGRRSHHKVSMKLILNDTQLPFTSMERRIIANVARYHRKALPNPTHYNLASLDRTTIHKVKVLASLLRVADSLDYSHQSIIENLNVKVGPKRVTVECVSKTKSTLEEQAFNKKKDLFEKVFAKKMVLIWKQPSKQPDM
jgi:putative phosphoesterase